MNFFTSWEPDPVGQILGTGYYRFESPLGICGLARIVGNELDLLAVVAERPGCGQFRRFINAAKVKFESISIWEDWNPVVGSALAKYGFLLATRTEKGETNTGWRWEKTK